MLTRVSTRPDMLFIGLTAFGQQVTSASKLNCVFSTPVSNLYCYMTAKPGK